MKSLLSVVLVLAMVLGFANVSFAEEVVEYTANSVNVYFDGTKTVTGATILHCSDSNEYPCIKLTDLATAIGGSVNGYTLTKDKVTIEFTAGSRIANYTHADYPNQADYMTTYYTNTSNILTGESSNKISSVATSLIPGETEDKSLSADYTNDGTDGENNGYILEYAPFMYNGELYVPLYCIVPTLNYHTEYFRFDSTPQIKITTGAKELSSYQTFYASDYGAKGDGVADDKDALLKGFYAAVKYNGASKFVLDEGKTYRVGERLDSTVFFALSGKNDFIFDGNGSTILFSTPVNSALSVNGCKNVIFKDLTFMYDEHTSTHGQIVSVGQDGTFTMKIAETVEFPANKDWLTNTGGKSYGFGLAYDLASKRPKFVSPDHFDISNVEVEDVDDRQVKVTISGSTASYVTSKLKAGDGFIINNRADGYDTNDNAVCITLQSATDIEFNGVSICGSNNLGVSVGLCDGNITFRNYKMPLKEGTATASSADGIHYWRNRATLLVENCELWSNLDDHINTKGQYSQVKEISGRTLTMDSMYLMFKPGDEVWFMKRDNGNTKNTSIGRAYVTEVVDSNHITIDRDVPTEISDLVTSPQDNVLPVLYNNMSSGGGTCIRGTKFIGSRRHAYISRSRNTIFMNNYIQNNGGSTVDASDEIGTTEGPFPDAFTIRNNRTYGDGLTDSAHVYGGIVVRSFRSVGDYANDTTTREINGALIQGNIIQLNTAKFSMFLNSIKDLYVSNNKILWNDSWTATENGATYGSYKPVYITNCDIKEFTNLTYEGPTVSTIVTTRNCDGEIN